QAELEVIAEVHGTRNADAVLWADVAEVPLEVMGIGQIGEYHRRVQRLHHSQAGGCRPDTVAGGQRLGNVQVIIVRLSLQLYAVGVFPRRRFDPQAEYRIRAGNTFIKKLVGHPEADISQIRPLGNRSFAVGGARSARSGGLIGRFSIDVRHVYIELPALTPVVTGSEIEGERIGIDLVDPEVAEKYRIQCQETVQK